VLVCTEPEIRPWRPDFSSSGQPSPTWLRLLVNGHELSNALDDLEWTPNPVQVHLCDACGYPGCATGGYADLSRLGTHVLWTPAATDHLDDWKRDQYAPARVLVEAGAALFPLPVWERLRQRVGGVPAAEGLTPTTRRMLAEAWRVEARQRLSGRSLTETMQHVGQLVLASDRWGRDDAVAVLTEVADWLAADPSAEVEGDLVPVASTVTVPETFYTDGPGEEDWPAVAEHDGRLSPAFRPGLVLWPPPIHRRLVPQFD
jgi:hypothetical protein